MTLVPFIYAWVALVAGIVGLAIWRQWLARQNHETLHLADREAALLAQRAITGETIRKIDFWGQWLTVIAVLYGFALLDIYTRWVWLTGAKPPG